jgi:biofilm PGA synthesis N-glycosyltransferase PgaC
MKEIKIKSFLISALMRLPPLPHEIIYLILFFGFFLAFFFMFVMFRKEEKIKGKVTNESVSFVIPAKNARRWIKKCIYSVINQNYPGQINIVVVNDGSTDGTEKIVEGIARKIKRKNRKIFLLSRESQGRKVFAVNHGLMFVLKKLKTPYIAILDADTIIDKNSLQDMLPRLQGKTACVISPIAVHNKKKLLAKLQSIEYTMSYFFKELTGRIESLCIAPAFSLFKTDFFVKHGLYDPNTITEDFEIAMRVKSRGYNIAMSKLKIYTAVPEGLRELRKQRIRWGYGEIQNILKYRHLVLRQGFFGIFFLPVVMCLGIIVLLTGFSTVIYMIISKIVNFIHSLSIGWTPNLSLAIKEKLNLFSLSLFASDPKIILIVFSILLSSFFFVYSHKYRKERINFFHYLIYIFIYSFLLAYFRLEGIIRYVFKIRTRW